MEKFFDLAKFIEAEIMDEIDFHDLMATFELWNELHELSLDEDNVSYLNLNRTSELKNSLLKNVLNYTVLKKDLSDYDEVIHNLDYVATMIKVGHNERHIYHVGNYDLLVLHKGIIIFNVDSEVIGYLSHVSNKKGVYVAIRSVMSKDEEYEFIKQVIRIFEIKSDNSDDLSNLGQYKGVLN